jgi:hypothetical protein
MFESFPGNSNFPNARSVAFPPWLAGETRPKVTSTNGSIQDVGLVTLHDESVDFNALGIIPGDVIYKIAAVGDQAPMGGEVVQVAQHDLECDFQQSEPCTQVVYKVGIGPVVDFAYIGEAFAFREIFAYIIRDGCLFSDAPIDVFLPNELGDNFICNI